MASNPNIYLLQRPAGVSYETVQVLEDLLREARAGNIQGFAYVALHAGVAMSHDTTGRCRSMPVLTLGMVTMLLREIEKIAT